MSGVQRIAAERSRQLESEGWTPERDDGYTDGSLVAAGECYALAARLQASQPIRGSEIPLPKDWPESWDPAWWKPSDDPARNLEKAGALFAAEIDRHERLLAAGEPERRCRVCGCTDSDCRGCVERAGEPCYWVEDDLCSACCHDG